MNTVDVTSPQDYARVGGCLYLAVILCGAFSEGFAMNNFIVPADAAATAKNILASPNLWELAVGTDLLVPVMAVIGVWISYVLLRPVSQRLVLLDVFLTLVSLAVEAVSKLFLLLVLPILNDESFLPSVGHAQLDELATIALKCHAITFDIALIFFGAGCLVEGYLLYESDYFPKFIGVLLQLSGVCYLISSLADLLAPSIATILGLSILLPPLVGELSYCLWLLIKGVDIDKWNERAAAARALSPPARLARFG